MLAKRVRNKHFRGIAILSIAGTAFKTEEEEKNLTALVEESCCREDESVPAGGGDGVGEVVLVF